MKVIVFAGGSGKRFWPVSRINAPKQFLNIQGESPMIKLTWDRLVKKFDPKDIYFDTGVKFEKEVRAILPDLPVENLILEPEMRDTGPAVSLAVAYLSKLFPDEVIACIWSDHLIKDEPTFLEALFTAERVCQEQEKIVFVAVPARFASPHRGYIHFGAELENTGNPKITVREFKRFEEKPNNEVAQEFLAAGTYAWNPGYWIFKGEQYLKKIKRTNPEVYEVCQRVVSENFSEQAKQDFSKLEKISADYLFAENVYASEAVVVYTDCGWSDIGEWISLKEALQENDQANVVKGNTVDLNSKDTLVYNYEEGKLVATIGLDGFVVVNTPDVVAIFPKEGNTKLKELLKGFEGKDLEKYL